MKRSDVTGNRFEWELGQNKVIYFIVLASSVTTMEVKAIEFHRIWLDTLQCTWFVIVKLETQGLELI